MVETELLQYPCSAIINPLSANVGYIRHDAMVTSDSCNSGHSENYEISLTFSCKSLKFSTKWYTKLCILVDPFLRNCVAKSNFRYFFKKKPKKALALKGLRYVNPDMIYIYIYYFSSSRSSS